MHRRNRGRLALAAALTAATAACGDLMDPGDPGNLVPETVMEDPTLPAITVGNTRLHSEAFGDPSDPMIMVLHGGPGADYRALLSLAELADDGFYVVFWDQRGAGLSQRHDAATYSLHGYLEDLRLVIEHYSASATQPVVFIGHSWGAMYATWFINEYGDYGDRVRGAILSEPGAFTSAQLDRYTDELMGSMDMMGEDMNDATWLYQFMSPSDHARADYIATVTTDGGLPAEHSDPDNPSPAWRAGAVVNRKLVSIVEDHGFDWTTNLGEFTAPVLFLRGELNEANPLSQQEEMASSYADATIVTIDDVGHEMIWEKPADYLGHARDYLATLDLN